MSVPRSQASSKPKFIKPACKDNSRFTKDVIPLSQYLAINGKNSEEDFWNEPWTKCIITNVRNRRLSLFAGSEILGVDQEILKVKISSFYAKKNNKRLKRSGQTRKRSNTRRHEPITTGKVASHCFQTTNLAKNASPVKFSFTSDYEDNGIFSEIEKELSPIKTKAVHIRPLDCKTKAVHIRPLDCKLNLKPLPLFIYGDGDDDISDWSSEDDENV